MKKIITVILAIAMIFSLAACSKENEQEKTEKISGTVEDNVYKNDLFDITFTIPEDWEAKKADSSEDSKIFKSGWSFPKKDGSGSTDIWMGYMVDEETPEEAFEYVSNLADEIYEDTIVEKRTETIIINGEEKDFILLYLDDGEFYCYVGIVEKLAYYDDEYWLLWSSFLYESEEETIAAIETVTSGSVKRKAVVPECGTFDGEIFKNEVFGIGFVVPRDWEYYAPKEVPNESTEDFLDWRFYASNGFGGLKVLHKKFSEDMNVDERRLIEEVIEVAGGEGKAFEENRVDTVLIDGKEEVCVFGHSSGEYTLYIPKIIEGENGGWACSAIFFGDSEEALLEYVERLTWDVEKANIISAEIKEKYKFVFPDGELDGSLFTNEYTGIRFIAPEGWIYKSEDELTANDDYGYYVDFNCQSDYIEQLYVDYQKYDCYGGKAATIGNYLAMRWYDEDNRYGAVFLSEETGTIEHCGKELLVETETYKLDDFVFHIDMIFIERENYLIMINIFRLQEHSLYDFLSYIEIS